MDVLQILCKTYYFVQAMSYTASVCILAVISLERFVAIIYPMHSRRLHSMSLLRATIVGVWSIAAASGLPYVFIYDTIDIPSGDSSGSVLQYCLMVHSFNARAYTCATFVLWYASPLAMMAFVYCRISVVLWRSSHGPRLMSTRASPASTAPAVRHEARISAESFETAQPRAAGGGATPVKCVVVSAESPADLANSDDEQERAGNSRGSSGGGGGRQLCHLGFQQHRAKPQRAGEARLQSPRCLITVERSSDDGNGSAVELRSLTGDGRETHGHRRAPPVATTDQTALSARRKVIRLLVAVVISFAVCVLPYHVRVLWQAFYEPQLEDWHLVITPVTFVLYYLNSGLNPLLYAFLSNKFRSSLIDMLCCRRARSTQAARLTYDAGGHMTMNTRTLRTASVC